MRSFLVIAGMLLVNVLSAQIVIRGMVFDKSTGNPVSQANVIVVGTSDGGTTSGDGAFEIVTHRQLPLQLTISDIRYKTQTVEVDRYNLLIGIYPDTKLLSEVVIVADPFVTIHPGDQYHAYDFEFCGDWLLILAFKTKKEESELFVADLKGNIDTSFQLPHGAKQLVADYSGTVHLITDDSAYQIYYISRHLYLLYPCHPQRLLQVLGACVGTFGGNVIWQYADMNRLRLSFFSGDGAESSLIFTVTDSLSLRYRNQRLPLSHFVSLRNSNDERYAYSITSLAKNLEYLRNTADLDWYDRKFMKPAQASFVVLDSMPRIFDYTNGKALVFDNNLHVIGNQDIKFHLAKGWQKKLYLDDVNNALYTTFQQNGITRIATLDQNNFEIIDIQEIENHRFIGKLKIKNNHAYFLHRDQITEGRRMVTKMALHRVTSLP